MVALDQTGFGVSRYHADRGYRSHLSLVLDETDAALLGVFANEVKAAAICCINVASSLNAVGFSKLCPLPQALASFSPSFPRSFEIVKSSRLALHLTPPVRAGLSGFSYYLRSMRDELAPLLVRNAITGGVTRQEVVAAREATNAASCFAKLTLKDTISIEQRLTAEYEVAHMGYLVALIDDVLEGKSPLLVDGQLEKAKTEFLVREKRVAINAEAIVTDPGSQERVVVSNLSQGGLAFRGNALYAPGQDIRIRLMTSGRELLGRIVWRAGHKAGMSFFDQLSAGDDLLLAA